MPEVFLIVAAVFAFASFLIWFALIRPVPMQQAVAVITGKVQKPAGTYWQQQPGINRGFRSAVPIPIAACCVLELDSAELGQQGRHAVSPELGETYAIGQRVVMDYQRRGLPLLGYKIMVMAIRPE